MLHSVIENLISVGWSMLIFLAAYLSNVTFSLWYNIKLQNQPFDRSKLVASAIKIATICDRPGPSVLIRHHPSLVCERSRLVYSAGIHRHFR